MHPRRSEVWWVSFDPSVGGEIPEDAAGHRNQ